MATGKDASTIIKNIDTDLLTRYDAAINGKPLKGDGRFEAEVKNTANEAINFIAEKVKPVGRRSATNAVVTELEQFKKTPTGGTAANFTQNLMGSPFLKGFEPDPKAAEAARKKAAVEAKKDKAEKKKAEGLKKQADKAMSSLKGLAELVTKEHENVYKLRKELESLKKKDASSAYQAETTSFGKQILSCEEDLDNATSKLNDLLKKHKEETEKLEAEKDAIEKAQAKLPKDMQELFDTSVYEKEIENSNLIYNKKKKEAEEAKKKA